MRRAIIGMGSNEGRREENLLGALRFLEREPRICPVAVSPVYRTEPMGPARWEFLNAAVLVETSLDPASLLARLQRCEREAGRPVDHEKWGPRVLDLDVLLVDDLVREGSPPILPHPGLTERDFALLPALDLDPDLVDPISGRPLAGYLDSLSARTVLGEPRPLPGRVDYDLLEHTADAGLAVRGATFAALLENAAMALADAVVPRRRLRESFARRMTIVSTDEETLLVDILQEVVFGLETRGALPVRVQVEGPEEGLPSVDVVMYCGPADPADARLAVKAATHHDLSLEEARDGRWEARVWLDV